MLTEHVTARATGTVRRGFEDGLGKRYSPATRVAGEARLEILCLCHEITDVPAFDFALRERVARLSDLQHPYYTRIRKVDRLNDEHGTVALMSDAAPGVRLSEILSDAERGGPVLDLNAALYLIRQLVSAIAVLHQHARVAHGAIAPERLFVTSSGRMVIVEHVLGAALEQLRYSRERYWKELRIALPSDAGLPRFDERADLTQIGVVALSLMLARPLRGTEYPQEIENLVGSVCARTPDGTWEPLPSSLRDWLRRLLQLSARSSFRSVLDAQTVLDQLLSEDGTYSASAGSLDAFLKRYHDSTMPASPSAKPIVTSDTSVTLIEPETDVPPLGPPAVDSMPAEKMTDERARELDHEEETMRLAQSGKGKLGRLKWIAAGLVLLIATTGGAFAARQRFSPIPPITVGTMTVSTDPPGAEVEIDGAKRGLTPLSLSLAPGAHTLVVRANGDSRTIPITVAAGAQISQYLELPKAGSAFGQLHVRTEPAGARVSVDGVLHGTSPITVVDLSPGEHTVTLEGEYASVNQRVSIEAGLAASLVVPLGAQAATLTGWISVTAPVVVDLYEQGRLLGTSGIDRIMLPTGKHEIELVSVPLDYRETRTVQVTPSRVSAISVQMPKGTVSINAVPWASVYIDGESIGDTPVGNIPLTIGPHEVVFRNTELGEQRRVITVTQRSPVRLSVDMAKQ